MEEPVKEKSPFFVDTDFVHRKTIVINGKEYEFGFKELSGFDKDKISNKAVSVDPKSQTVETKAEIANHELLKTVLVEAPFEINDENLKKLTAPLREELLKISRDINKVEEKIIKN